MQAWARAHSGSSKTQAKKPRGLGTATKADGTAGDVLSRLDKNKMEALGLQSAAGKDLLFRHALDVIQTSE